MGLQFAPQFSEQPPAQSQHGAEGVISRNRVAINCGPRWRHSPVRGGDRHLGVETAAASGIRTPGSLSQRRGSLWLNARGAKTQPRNHDRSRAGPRVRILLPPAESLSLAGLYLPRQEPRLSARVSGLRSRRGRQRAAGAASSAPTRSNISVGPYSSTPFPAMRSRQVVGLKLQRGSPRRDRTLFGSVKMVDVASAGSRSTKAERGPLVVPGKRQAGVRE
jgi:hypothetical protein